VKEPEFEEPTFAYREVVLGPEAGGQYVVSEGLQEGEEIVANGVFKIDAAAQLQGKVSMMNPPLNGVDSNTGTARFSSGKTLNEVSAEFQQQLASTLDPYLELKNALVASNAQGAAEAARQTEQALEEVEMSLISGGAHQQWMVNLKVMQEALISIRSNVSLESQRAAFAPLSEALFRSIQHFNVTGLKLYYQYCPMADRDQGAYWLSEVPEINNPYFGEAMLRCGETRETLE
jgi:Cu(I)/Ag(I) efflux system membrane fusion protein